MSDSTTEMISGHKLDTMPYSTEWYAGLQRLLGETACRQLGFYAIPSHLLLSVIIPVYNERDTIHDILARVKAVPVRKEIVLVDDCSQDGTREMLKQLEDQERAQLAELSAAGSVSTYDAVLRLRPYFFRDRGPTSLVNRSTRTRSVVFVDDREYGEIESLKNFPAERVEEVRFYSGLEATTRFGSAYGAGVIQLRMRTR